MKDALVLREGREWMKLRRVDARGRLWVVIDGTVAMAGDIVRVPRLGLRLWEPDSDAGEPVSPFETEIVVDTLTRAVLFPESGRPSNPAKPALRLFKILQAAGLREQARIVWEWMRSKEDNSRAGRRAA